MRNSLNRILSNKLTQCAVTFIFIFFSGSLAFAAIADVKLLDRSPWTDILWAAAAFLIGVVNMSLLIHTVEEDAESQHQPLNTCGQTPASRSTRKLNNNGTKKRQSLIHLVAAFFQQLTLHNIYYTLIHFLLFLVSLSFTRFTSPSCISQMTAQTAA